MGIPRQLQPRYKAQLRKTSYETVYRYWDGWRVVPPYRLRFCRLQSGKGAVGNAAIGQRTTSSFEAMGDRQGTGEAGGRWFSCKHRLPATHAGADRSVGI